MKLLRIKQPNCEVVVIDISKILGFSIELWEDMGQYELTLMTTNSVACCVNVGTFDSCHNVLNMIIDKLDLNILDL